MPLNHDGLADAIVNRVKQENFRNSINRKASFWKILEYGSDEENSRSYEIRYSRILKWLLDPSGTHGLGAYFADGLIACVAKAKQDTFRAFHIPGEHEHNAKAVGAALLSGEIHSDGVTEVLLSHHRKIDESRNYSEVPPRPLDTNTTVVKAEKNNIDVLLTDESTKQVLVIENKMHAAETVENGVSQLERYYDSIQRNHKTYEGGKYFLYLTLEGKLPLSRIDAEENFAIEPEWSKAWVPLSYGDIGHLLEGAILRTEWQGNRDARKIIEDFYYDSQEQAERYNADSGTESIRNEFFGVKKTSPHSETAPNAFLREIVYSCLAMDVVSTADAHARLGKYGDFLPTAEALTANERTLAEARKFWRELQEAYRRKLPEYLRDYEDEQTLRSIVSGIWNKCPDFNKQTRTLNPDMEKAIEILKEKRFSTEIVSLAEAIVERFNGARPENSDLSLGRQSNGVEWSLNLNSTRARKSSYRIAKFYFGSGSRSEGEYLRVDIAPMNKDVDKCRAMKDFDFTRFTAISDAHVFKLNPAFRGLAVIRPTPLKSRAPEELWLAMEQIANLTRQAV